MSALRFTCPQHGEVEVEGAGVVVRWHQPTGAGTPRGSVTFTCPGRAAAHDLADVPLVLEDIGRLMTAGATFCGSHAGLSVSLPDELADPARREAAPLTEDDLIAFGGLLEAAVDPLGHLASDARVVAAQRRIRGW